MFSSLGSVISTVFEYLPKSAYLEFAFCSAQIFTHWGRDGHVFDLVTMETMISDAHPHRFHRVVLLTHHSPCVLERFLQLEGWRGQLLVFKDSLLRLSHLRPVRHAICFLHLIDAVESSELSWFPNVTTLAVCCSFRGHLSADAFPAGLRKLDFGKYFNQPLSVGTLPETLEEIEFGNKFNQELLPRVLPSHLKKLVLGDGFDRQFDVDSLPATLSELKIGNGFNKTLSIQMGDRIKPILPNHLRKLNIGGRFSCLRCGELPAELEILSLKGVHGSAITFGLLPMGLVHLDLGFICDGVKDPAVLPTSLRSARFTLDQPRSLTHLTNLVVLVLGFDHLVELSENIFPPTLNTLELTYGIKAIHANALPMQLHSLRLRDSFDGTCVLPPYLKEFAGGHGGCGRWLYYNLPEGLEMFINRSLCSSVEGPPPFPNSLQKIRFESGLSTYSLSFLPRGLKSLWISHGYYDPILPGDLPPALEELNLGDTFNQPIETNVLPDTLRSLGFGKRFQHVSSLQSLPPNLQHLQIPVELGYMLPPGLNRSALRTLTVVHRDGHCNGECSEYRKIVPLTCEVNHAL